MIVEDRNKISIGVVMQEDNLMEIIRSQQETIKQLLRVIEELSKDRDINIVPMPYNDSDDDKQPYDTYPWGVKPWVPYEEPYPSTPYIGEGPWGTVTICSKE